MSAVAGRPQSAAVKLTLLTYFQSFLPTAGADVNAADQMPAIPVAFTLLPHSPVTTVLLFLLLCVFSFCCVVTLNRLADIPHIEVKRI